jgi:hypothetical protein
MTVPNFLIIGAGKSGTTVQVSRAPEPLDFFAFLAMLSYLCLLSTLRLMTATRRHQRHIPAYRQTALSFKR